MVKFGTISDPVFAKPAFYGAFNKFLLRFINDERDLPFVYLILRILFTLFPVAILLFLPLPSVYWWFLAIGYVIYDQLILNGPFTLMLHCTSHRPLFKSQYKILNEIIPWVIGPLFGQSPGTYYSHHMGMHHAENNLEHDLSSTMMYQRDSFGDFMKYFTRFFFGVIVSLTNYHHMRKRVKMRNKVLKGEVFFILISLFLMWLSIPAVLVIFIIPLFISRFAMMMGNWAQHAFVDFNDPGNCYKNSITCINTSYNKTCFNDGYHINHHLKPNLHYTDYPIHFQENTHLFAQNKAIVFENIHYLHVWFYLMTKNYTALSNHSVNLEDRYLNDSELIILLKERTKKMALRGITAKNYKSRIQAA